MSREVPPAAGPSLFDDLAAALLWPKLFRAPALALRPQRVLLSLFLLVLVWLIGGLSELWHGPDKPTFLEASIGAKADAWHLIGSGLLALDTRAVVTGFSQLVGDVPALLFTEYPVSVFVLGIPIIIVIAILGGAVCRSVACEFSQEITLPWPRQLAFAARRWRSLVGVLIIPSAVMGVLALVQAIAGAVFFSGVPVLDLLGALLYALAVCLSLCAVLLLLLACLAWPMLLPAVACEGTDAIDAVQRAVAYAVARPLRLLLYLLLAGVLAALAIAVAAALARGADLFAQSAVSAWASPKGVAEVTGAFPADARLTAEGEVRELSGIAAASAWLVNFWSSLLYVVAGAYAVSVVLTAGTLIYLLMRQVCDGQHYAEIWTPGQVEAGLTASLNPTTTAPPPDPAQT